MRQLPATEILAIKDAVRVRDGNKCVKCGMTGADHQDIYEERLQVHRVDPGSVYSTDGCITLCQPCHVLEPKSKKHGGLTTRIVVSCAALTKLYRVAAYYGFVNINIGEFLEDMVEAEITKIDMIREMRHQREEERNQRLAQGAKKRKETRDAREAREAEANDVEFSSQRKGANDA